MNTYIGIDIGTSAVKLMLVDQKGLILNKLKVSYKINYPQNGWSEQDPEMWFKKTMFGLKELLKEQLTGTVKSIAFAGQMHGLVIVNQKDEVIRPSILWNDGRSQNETNFLNRDKLFLKDHVSNIAFSGFTATKILWLKNNETNNFTQINKIMLPKDYLVYKFTGIHSTDESDAGGTLLYDVGNHQWSKEMCDLCGIDISFLPKVHNSTDIIGTINEKIAKKLNLSADVKIIAGASDNAAAAIGNGVIDDNQCNLSLGTSGTLFIPLSKKSHSIHESIHHFGFIDGKTHLLSCILSAASSNQWWVENILNTVNYQNEVKDLDKLMGKNNVLFLPYLMGERSPHNDAYARASFIGMTANTTRKEMTLAVMEGVAFALKDSLNAIQLSDLDIKSVRVCGGGTKIEVWLQIISSVLDVDLEILEFDDGAAYGAAILAVAGYTGETLTSILSNIIKIKRLIKPNPSLVEHYKEKYLIYKTLYPTLKKTFSKISKRR